MTTGALVAVQGYTDFSEIGVEALTGFASAFFNVRLIAPATTAIALAATIGAGATAQLGAMRINDEIDALEVMGIRSVAYLASTRVIAGLVVVIPLYCVGVLASFWAAQFGTTVLYGQSTGVYDHYFRTFLNPTDLMWSFVQSIAHGGGDHAGTHLLRLHRERWAGRSGGGGRARGAYLADHLGVRGDDDLACRVRAIRQLQSGRVAPWPRRRKDEGLHAGWWTLILLLLLIASIWLTYVLFTGSLKSFVPVTLTSDRSGLVMETNAKVKLRGVQVGRVASITGGREPVALETGDLPGPDRAHPGQCRGADPGNHVVRRQVRRPGLSRATPARSASGPVRCCSRAMSATEVNTVFENVVDVLDQIDPAKLNSVLSALAEGVRGQGERIGQATTDANQVLLALNPRSETDTGRLAGAEGVQRHL